MRGAQHTTGVTPPIPSVDLVTKSAPNLSITPATREGPTTLTAQNSELLSYKVSGMRTGTGTSRDPPTLVLT